MKAAICVHDNNELENSSIARLLDSWFPVEDFVLQQLREQLQFVRLGAQHNVFRRGDNCGSYLLVVQGSVRVYTVSPTGREVVLYRVRDGESCVITTACLISGEAYPAIGVTEAETVALVVPRAVFNSALMRSPAFQRFVFASHGKRLGDLIQRIEDITFGRVDARLARLLLERNRKADGAIAATHQQLANEIGTAREVISRQLKQFARRGWIKVLRGSVEVLRPDALVRVSQELD